MSMRDEDGVLIVVDCPAGTVALPPFQVTVISVLSVLVIVKLPFDVPSDPIIAARSETFDDAFNEYSLPEAILRFRQGFGRLIRTQSDRGVVVVLDRRLLTKRYGKAFIESLPTCKLRVGPMADIPSAAARWLNL